MSDDKDDGEVTRLVDMVVQEVSLVDRAANKRRFLIVKRNETMAKARGKAKDPNDDETAAEDEAEGGDGAPPAKKPKRPFPPKAKAKKPADADAEPDEEEEGDEDDAPPPRGRRRGAKKEAPDPMSALGLTLATLDKLASAVEGIEADEDADDDAYAELARDLRKASLAIAKSVGVELDEDDEETDAHDEEPSTSSAKPGDHAAGVLTAVRDMLTRLEGALAPQGSGASPASAPAAGVANGGEVAKTLRSIVTAMKGIDTSVRAQNARLATLEKRTGLPNSQTPERSPRPRDVSWPLDINRPMDRGSVTKELSFHDKDD